MKILWVKVGGLVPLDTGGKIRSFNILRELARRHDVQRGASRPGHEHVHYGWIEGEIVSLRDTVPEIGRRRVGKECW